MAAPRRGGQLSRSCFGALDLGPAVPDLLSSSGLQIYVDADKVPGGLAGHIGNRVLVGGAKEGVLRFFGPIHLKPEEEFCGIELLEPAGKNDGTLDGRKYFDCPSGHGIFAPTSKVQLIAVTTLSFTTSLVETKDDSPTADRLTAAFCDSGIGTSGIGAIEEEPAVDTIEMAESGTVEAAGKICSPRRSGTFDLDEDETPFIGDEAPLESLSSSTSALADDPSDPPWLVDSSKEPSLEPLCEAAAPLSVTVAEPDAVVDASLLTPTAEAPPRGGSRASEDTGYSEGHRSASESPPIAKPPKEEEPPTPTKEAPTPRKKASPRGPVLPPPPPPKSPKKRLSVLEQAMQASAAAPAKPKAPKPLSKAQLIQQQLKESMAKDKLKPKKTVESKLVASLVPSKEPTENGSVASEDMRSRASSTSSNIRAPTKISKPGSTMPISSGGKTAATTRKAPVTASRVSAPRPPTTVSRASTPSNTRPSSRASNSSTLTKPKPPTTTGLKNGTSKLEVGTARTATSTAKPTTAAATSSAPKKIHSTPMTSKKLQEELAKTRDSLGLEKGKATTLASRLDAASTSSLGLVVTLQHYAAKAEKLAATLQEARRASHKNGSERDALSVELESIRSQLSSAIEQHQQDLATKLQSLAGTHAQELAELRAAHETEKSDLAVAQARQLSCELSERERKHVDALEELRGSLERRVDEWRRKAEAEAAELETLSGRYADLSRQHEKLSVTVAKNADAKLKHAMDELHSYKEVNEMQAGELRGLKGAVAKLTTKAEEIPPLESRLAKQAQELADLHAQIARKKDLERHLSETNAQLVKDKLDAEHMSTSIRMEKDQLQFKLEEMSKSLMNGSGADMASSLYISPRVRPSMSQSETTDPMTKSVYGAEAFGATAKKSRSRLRSPSKASVDSASKNGAEEAEVAQRRPSARAPLRPAEDSRRSVPPASTAAPTNGHHSAEESESAGGVSKRMGDSGIGSLSCDPNPS